MKSMKRSGSIVVNSIVIGVILSVGTYVAIKYLHKSKTPSWIEHVAKMTAHQKSGILTGTDKQGKMLTFEWERTANSTPSSYKKEIVDIRRQANAPILVDFLRKHPEALSTIDDWKPAKPLLEPLFKNGIDKVDWRLVEEKIRIEVFPILEQEEIKNSHKPLQMITWTVVVKDKTGPLGFILFSVSPESAYGYIHIRAIYILPIAQHRGLGKLLISSIFSILSSVNIKLITIRTFKTNEQAQAAYVSYGFKQYKNPNKKADVHRMDYYEVDFEYKLDQSDVLQREAEKLVEKS